jgi:Zn-dependent peptidase ImmA (M78 family)
MARRHPELERQVLWPDVVQFCEREKILLRRAIISDEARLLRFGQHVCIQLSRQLDEKAATIFTMHELCHFWRDDPGEPCYYADSFSTDPREEFADIFAWYVTAPDRPKLRDTL